MGAADNLYDEGTDLYESINIYIIHTCYIEIYICVCWKWNYNFLKIKLRCTRCNGNFAPNASQYGKIIDLINKRWDLATFKIMQKLSWIFITEPIFVGL